jgi:hypothetical protein
MNTSRLTEEALSGRDLAAIEADIDRIVMDRKVGQLARSKMRSAGQAAEDALSVDEPGVETPQRQRFDVRSLLLTGLVRPMTVVMLGVSHEHRLKMPAIDDEHPVQQFPSYGPD